MKRDPITRQRSPWVERPDYAEKMIRLGTGLEPDLRVFQRRVHDGHLTAMVGTIPGEGLHLSISHRTNHDPPREGRYPTWDEIAHARDELLPADREFHMVLPRTDGDEYLAVHKTTFHLHETLPDGVLRLDGRTWRVESPPLRLVPYRPEKTSEKA